jgi:hypothetical protein
MLEGVPAFVFSLTGRIEVVPERAGAGTREMDQQPTWVSPGFRMRSLESEYAFITELLYPGL